MMDVEPRKSRGVEKIEFDGESLFARSAYGLLRVTTCPEGILRVSFTREEAFQDENTPYILQRETVPARGWSETNDELTLEGETLTARIRRADGGVSVYDGEGRLVFAEGGLRTLGGFTAKKIAEGSEPVTETVVTPDGKKTVIRDAVREDYKRLYHARLPLRFGENEAVYGLGQPENGPANLRGRRLYVCHGNQFIPIPFYTSTAGYGLLVDCGCSLLFNDTAEGSYLYMDAVPELTYYILPGKPEQVVEKYHFLTGLPAPLPVWAFGYMQCRERYETAEEILSVAKGCDERGIGVDTMILDWQSWPGTQWGQKTFDPARFPDPKAMTDALHASHKHFMISVWPNPSQGTPNNEEFKAHGSLLPGNPDTYNPLLPEARRIYWKQLEEGLYRYGVDAWWCDSSEPWTTEWNEAERPEASETWHKTTEQASDALGADRAAVFPFYHAMAVYEGQTGADPERRVCNLTRAGWTGQQRFGTILWSGDISARWSTLKKQIAVGLDAAASGIPYWTLDIGGFFVKRGVQWFWDGDFDEGWADPEYRELFIRWYQYAAFLPVFRGHGTDFRRELWNLAGEEFEAAVKYNRLRYRLLPYIYTTAAKAAAKGGTIIRPVGFMAPDDPTAVNVDDAFFLGNDLLVCPVTEYKARSRRVYLPEGLWVNFDTGERLTGGRWVEAEAPLDRIPLFVRAGAVIPMSRGGLNAFEAMAEAPELMVFSGADGTGLLYTDDGETYACRRGEYTLRRFNWNEAGGTLTDDRGEPVPFIGR